MSDYARRLYVQDGMIPKYTGYMPRKCISSFKLSDVNYWLYYVGACSYDLNLDIGLLFANSKIKTQKAHFFAGNCDRKK